MSNPNAPWNKNQPDRALVERIAREEAHRALVSPSMVIGTSRDARAVKARQAAMRRILKETGCSINGLAEVWGCEVNSVRIAVAKPSAPEVYDAAMRERLRWAHGDLRAEQIISGSCPKTQADIRRWRDLGRGRSAA